MYEGGTSEGTTHPVRRRRRVAVVACGSSTSANVGKAGDAAQAARTVDVHILSSKMYTPASVTVRSAETVTFKVTNDDRSLHEFVLGDQKAQDEHEKVMKACPWTA